MPVESPAMCVSPKPDMTFPIPNSLYYFHEHPPFFHRRDAKEKGFDDNLYLELDTYHNPPPRRATDGSSSSSTSSSSPSRLRGAILQELSAANVFLVLRTGEIVTPSLKRGTILPGEWKSRQRVQKKIPFVLRTPTYPSRICNSVRPPSCYAILHQGSLVTRC